LRRVAIILVALVLVGCTTTTSNRPTREEAAINDLFDGAVSRETDPLIVQYIEKSRQNALNALASASSGAVRHRLALHIMNEFPANLEKAKTIVRDRRRCEGLQARLEAEGGDVHELVRTLSIAGCSDYMKLR
jgi:hypothetical protein